MQKYRVFRIFLIATLLWSQSSLSQQISLKQAVDQALLSSPQFLTSKNQLEASQLEAKNAAALFLPQLNLESSIGNRGYNPDRDNLTAVTPWTSSTSLLLTQNFYDNGETFKKSRIADLKYELAKIYFDRTKAQVIRAVTIAYYRYGIANQSLKFVNKNYNELERLARLVQNQFQQGMKTRKDYLSFKTRAQRTRIDVIRAEENLKLAHSQLISLIGLPPNESIDFDENIRPHISKKPLDTEIKDQDLYELKAFELQKSISELEVDLSKRRYWPELSLTATATYGSADYVDTRRTWSDNDQTSWGVFLNLKFNILDWGIRSRNIKITRLNQNTAEQTLYRAYLDVKRDLEVFKLEVEKSEENYRLSKELQQMEEDTFNLLERDYKSGVATYLELTTGLANLLDAQARGLEADLDQADLYLRWKYYRGILNEETLFQ